MHVSVTRIYSPNSFCEQVLFAFMVGMTNLYRYYGTQMIKLNTPASESFKGFDHSGSIIVSINVGLYRLFVTACK